MLKLKLGLAIKLIIATTILLLSTVSILSFFFIDHERKAILKALEERGSSLAASLAYNCEYGVLTANIPILNNFIEGIMKQSDVAYCIIQDAEGKPLVSQGQGNELMIPKGIASKAQVAEEPLSQYFSSTGNKYYYEFSVPVKSKAAENVQGEEAFFQTDSSHAQASEKVIGVVRLGVSLARINVLFGQIQHVIILIILGLLFVSSIATIFFTKTLLAPVDNLVEATRRVALGDLSFKVSAKTSDELGALALSFNKMIEDLRKITVSRDDLAKEVTERTKAEQELIGAYEQLKQVQAKLVQSAKMASVGLLAGGVAHEINNPLTGVLNNIQLIKLMAGQQKNFNLEDFSELFNVIESSAQRCANITRSLLDFSRASKGVFLDISMNDIIEKVMTLIEVEMKLQNVVLAKDLEPGIPTILGDAQLLQQVIFDIVVNAKWAITKKSEKETGTISIKSRFDKVKKNIVIHISDTGVGIPRENLEKIFEPFFTTKDVGEGTGLGLSIVYSIIKAHNGLIEAESEVGKGTTFKISLPVLVEDKAPATT